MKQEKVIRVHLLLSILFITGCAAVVGGSSSESTSSASSTPTDDSTNVEGYTLVWSDEFDGSGLDSSKWVHETGYGSWGWGNNEWQNYTPSATTVADGILTITADASGTPASRNGSVTSSRIITKGKFSFKYGKVIGRIKTPLVAGIWPAFWMLGENISSVGWPKCGEIDILEMFTTNGSTVRQANFAAHWYNDATSGHKYYTTKLDTGTDLTADYHLFETEWDETSIKGKIDGQLYFNMPITDSNRTEFHEKFYILLNIAVGGTLGGDATNTPFPQKMQVDYIRVYQKDSDDSGGGGGNSGGLLNDTNSDGKVAVYYPGVTADIPKTAAAWGSGSVLNSNYTADATFSPVIEATSGSNWGADAAVVAFTGFNAGFASTYSNVNFKIKDLNSNASFKVKFAGGGQDVEKSYNFSSYTATSGWYTVSIPMSEFTGKSANNEFAIFTFANTKLYVTDVYFN